MKRILWAVADVSVAVIAATAVGFTGYVVISIVKGVFA